MYIRIFDDGPRACGADTLEWYPAWYVYVFVGPEQVRSFVDVFRKAFWSR